MSCIKVLIPPFFFIRWQVPEMRDLAQIQHDVMEERRKLGKPLVYISIIPADAEPPEPEVRKALMDSMPGVLEHCDSMHFVIEGGGFKHTLLRSALAGILLVSGRRGKVFVHMSVDEAVEAAAKPLRISPAGVIREAAGHGLLTEKGPGKAGETKRRFPNA